METRKVVLTADRSLMSNFRGNYILGFLSCAPSSVVPGFVYNRIFAPPIEANPDGSARAAPMGLRRLESALLQDSRYVEGEVLVAHPHCIREVIGEDTEIIGVSVMDPLGKGPVTSSFTHNTEHTPMNAVEFQSLTNDINELVSDARVVVGGGGAWQLENRMEEFDIDYLVLGEVGHNAPDVFESIVSGSADPVIFSGSPKSMDEVPEIKGPTINSVLEAMRGCGRGCSFCGPNNRRKIYADVDRLKREAEVNSREFRHIWLHSEDILLYKHSSNFVPNREEIRNLYESILNVEGIEMVGTTHINLAGVVSAPEVIGDISKLNGLSTDRWTGIQPGLETGSPRLIDKHMRGKALPFEPEDWPNIVEEGIRILNDNYIYPACTLVIGLPGETEEDVDLTIELIENLSDTHSIFAPLMYMDYRGEATVAAYDMSPKQLELFYKCWRHNVDEIQGKVWRATKGWNPISRIVSKLVVWLGGKTILHKLDRMKIESGLEQ